jgi:hypothetical protein
MAVSEMYPSVTGDELRVVVLSDIDGWFAQGKEIDHSAEASTLEDVKRAFETGLSSLVSRLLSARGNLKLLLRPTPDCTWSDLWEAGKVCNVSSTSFKDLRELKALPFSGISYFEQTEWVGRSLQPGTGEKRPSRANGSNGRPSPNGSAVGRGNGSR